MNAINGPLHVLLVEDSENDASLLEIELERAGYDPICQRVETAEAMKAALDRQPWDVVIADYVMPHFNGLAALALVKERNLDLPFIVVSGHITEDTAVASMKAGAHDYVMKDKLARLGPAVDRELREAEVRRQRRRSEENLKVEHGITRVLASADSLDEAAPEIVQLLLDGLKVDVASLWVVDARKQLLRFFEGKARTQMRAGQSFLKSLRGFSFEPGSGLPGCVWKQRQAVWAPNFSKDPDFERSSAAAQAGLRSAVAFPIQNSGDFAATLEFFTVERLEYDLSLLNMMTAICAEIGQFIRRRNAEEQVRRANEQLQRAHDLLEVRVQQRTAQLKQTNGQLQTAIQERERLEHELLEITEKERRRIGLDLHDDLGQKLTGIAFMTKALGEKLSHQHGQEAKIAAEIHGLVQDAMNHTSKVAKDLATLDFKERDLPSALSDLAAHASKLFGISCLFTPQGKIPRIEPNKAVQLYKIAQEAVNNAFKHGKAKKVKISLSNGSRKLVLSVQNSGKPFPDLHSHSRTGMGLRIMNYRASLIGGSLDIKGNQTNGTLLTCTVPLKGKE